MREYQIWAEGYSCTGNESGATLLATVEADSFVEAVRAWVAEDPCRSKLYLEVANGPLTYWGCALFDNEHDSRITFG
jgi:hypothetical protein